ncbi:cob(I)yrinic acid a,c-diamide adenosyltransferase [Roseobacter sp. HKCCA0434]|uniref:cob(I)yrinic acid a,c-diamide adenosyltransferase n=1 Tax=Roseobacter sp. HKCCA0434 TaxID=3079297 RepID=UPI002905A60D|nr:cob(I)yrinic acid a,c-diamide adenosyltransferase [Roseobacter sp. HKCCA0434]
MSDSNDEHAKAMQQVQTEHRAKMATKTKAERGLVLIHTGKGKGKSSSAFGVVARALGWDQKVGVVQFIKGTWRTGEKQFFDRFPELDWHTMGDGFTWDTQDREQDVQAAMAAFAQAAAMMTSDEYDLIVLDEINIALRYDYLDAQAVKEALEARARKTSVILTGRDAPQLLMDYADLVTEMTEVKHPFQAGIKAQRGVDY